MHWIRLAALFAVASVAVGAGGAAVRVGALGRPQALAALAVLAAAALVTVLAAAKSRRWLENPYW